MRSRFLGTAILLLVVTTACGGDGPTTPSGSGSSGSGGSGGSGGGGTGGGVVTANGSIGARVDNAVWNATTVGGVMAGGVLTIGGSDATTNLSFGIPSSTGTFSGANGVAGSFSTTAGAGWVVGAGLGSASVTVTSLTANGAAGTFSFTMIPAAPGTTGNKSITDGSFNVKW